MVMAKLPLHPTHSSGAVTGIGAFNLSAASTSSSSLSYGKNQLLHNPCAIKYRIKDRIDAIHNGNDNGVPQHLADSE